jgi:hypothetical protein
VQVVTAPDANGEPTAIDGAVEQRGVGTHKHHLIRRHACHGEMVIGPDSKSTASERCDVGNVFARS